MHLPNRCTSAQEAILELIVVIVILLLLFGSFPTYGYSRNWGYFPSGTLGTILLIFLILWLLHVV
jgi:hypothetical protein